MRVLAVCVNKSCGFNFSQIVLISLLARNHLINRSLRHPIDLIVHRPSLSQLVSRQQFSAARLHLIWQAVFCLYDIRLFSWRDRFCVQGRLESQICASMPVCILTGGRHLLEYDARLEGHTLEGLWRGRSIFVLGLELVLHGRYADEMTKIGLSIVNVIIGSNWKSHPIK